MIIKVDQRTPEPLAFNFHGIELVKEYKYLGFNIRNDLSMEITIKLRSDLEKRLKKNDYILVCTFLDGLGRYHIWLTLFRSKINYSINIATIFCKKLAKYYEGYIYRACLLLLKIKGKPNKQRTLLFCLGKTFKEFLLIEQKNSLANICNTAVKMKEFERVKQIERAVIENGGEMPERKARGGYVVVNHKLPIKDILKEEISGSEIKWRLGIAFNFGDRDNAQYKCPCPENKKIGQKHFQTC